MTLAKTLRLDNHLLWMGIAAALAIIIGGTITATTDTSKISTDAIKLIGLLGELWLRSLRAIVLPLIFTNMIMAAHSLSHIPSGAGRIAKHTLFYYISTTVFACIEGLVICFLFIIPFAKVIDLSKLPVDITELAEKKGEELIKRTPIDQIVSIFTNLIPTNIFAAFTGNDFLGVIVTGVVIGFLIRDTPAKPSYILKICHEVEHFVAVLIKFLISVGPIGVFFLILPSLLTLDIRTVFEFVGIYIATTIGGCFFHVLVVYPIIYLVIVRKNPYAFLVKCLPSIITAFGTSSSAATLPVTMDVAKNNLKIPDHISRFCLNIGTTCNMDGAAIGFPIAVIFQAVSTGRSVTFVECVIIVITSAMAAIGASPIPSAGLVLIIMVMNSIGLPVTPLFGLIVAVDFIPDRFQTANNVLGDLFGSAIVYKLNPDLEENDDILAYEKQVMEAHEA